LHDRIAGIRKSLGLSQEAFGIKISMSRSAISNIESNAKPLTSKNLKLICQEFNVNEEWLRTGEGEMFIEINLSLLELLGEKINKLTEIEKKALYEFIKLPDNQRGIIMDFIKKIGS